MNGSKRISDKLRKFVKEHLTKQNICVFTQKMLYTIAMYESFMVIGFCYCILSVSFSNIQVFFRVGEVGTGALILVRSIGALIACPVAGVLYKFALEKKRSGLKFNHLMFGSVLILVISQYLTPFTANFIILVLIYLVQGFGIGILENGVYLGTDVTWKKWSVAALLANSFHTLVFGVSNIVLPLIMSQVYEIFYEYYQQLVVGFLISGALSLLPTVLLCGLDSPKDYEEEEEEEEEETVVELENEEEGEEEEGEEDEALELDNIEIKKEENDTGNNEKLEEEEEEEGSLGKIKSFGKQIFTIPFLVYFLLAIERLFCIGLDITFSGLLFNYCVRKEFASMSEISLFISACSFSYTFGKLIFFPFMFVKPEYTLLVLYPLELLGMILLLVFSDNFTYFYIVSVGVMFFMSSIPNLNMYKVQSLFGKGFELNSMRMGLLTIFQYSGEGFVPLACTFLSEDYILGVDGFLWVLIISGIGNCVIHFFLFTWGMVRVYGKKCKKSKKLEEEEEEGEDENNSNKEEELKELPINKPNKVEKKETEEKKEEEEEKESKEKENHETNNESNESKKDDVSIQVERKINNETKYETKGGD